MSGRTVVVTFLLALLLTSAVPLARAEDKKQHVLIADFTKAGVVHTLNGRDTKEMGGLLLALSAARDADPNAKPDLTLLVHERAKLSEVSNLLRVL